MVEQGGAEHKYLIFGIGNPLLDLSKTVQDEELLKKYKLGLGLACLAEESHMPIYKELWEMEGVDRIPGGSALNSMRSAAVS